MVSPTSKSKSNVLAWTFHSPEQMKNWGKKFSHILTAGDVVALVGSLGAGKTTLTQGIAAGLGYKRGAVSPTFALANEYKTLQGNVYHMDMYRLSPPELETFPLQDYWGQGICLIEWADRVRDRWPSDTLEIRLSAPGSGVRRLEIQTESGSWRKRLAKISGD
jgi:tRNA threonylcarbamoyladenosine biosynthesis protein TsaE